MNVCLCNTCNARGRKVQYFKEYNINPLVNTSVDEITINVLEQQTSSLSTVHFNTNPIGCGRQRINTHRDYSMQPISSTKTRNHKINCVRELSFFCRIHVLLSTRRGEIYFLTSC